jgi:regulator of nonsense transcripts 3
MTEESFLEHISPLFDHDYFYFVRGEPTDHNFSRAYINFVNLEDVFTFTQKFDDYVFIDNAGTLRMCSPVI